MTPAKTNEGRLVPSLFSDFFDTTFFNDDFMGVPLTRHLPAVNVKETPREFVVEVSAPGFKKENFKVNLENDVLSIEAETKEEKTEENERYARKEFRTASFSRSFRLPKEMLHDKVDARYENGILLITLPKKEETKNVNTREIKVS